MIYKREELEDGQKVWGYAYQTNNSEKGMALKKLPVNGVVNVKGGYRDGGFYELNKKGEPIKSSRVSLYARQYADTYEESVELYDRNIYTQIAFFTGIN